LDWSSGAFAHPEAPEGVSFVDSELASFTGRDGERAMDQEAIQQDYLSREHLSKAIEAETLAAQARDAQVRTGWLKIAECYRELAREAGMCLHA
jgi:hypothetical protein